MAMNKAQIMESLNTAFGRYVQAQRQENIKLGCKLAVLRNEAKLARLPDGEFDSLAREEMEKAAARMERQAKHDHPVVHTSSAVA